MSYPDTLRGWHDFYITAGAASATLAGLLFVGISLHVRTVVTHADVRGLARETLSTFFVVLVLALLLLAPAASAQVTGAEVSWVAAAGIVATIAPTADAVLRSRRHALPRRVLFIRFGLTTLSLAGLGVVGAVFASGDSTDGLAWLVAVVLVMLVIAVRNTWDLLVTVAEPRT